MIFETKLPLYAILYFVCVALIRSGFSDDRPVETTFQSLHATPIADVKFSFKIKANRDQSLITGKAHIQESDPERPSTKLTNAAEAFTSYRAADGRYALFIHGFTKNPKELLQQSVFRVDEESPYATDKSHSSGFIRLFASDRKALLSIQSAETLETYSYGSLYELLKEDFEFAVYSLRPQKLR